MHQHCCSHQCDVLEVIQAGQLTAVLIKSTSVTPPVSIIDREKPCASLVWAVGGDASRFMNCRLAASSLSKEFVEKDFPTRYLPAEKQGVSFGSLTSHLSSSKIGICGWLAKSKFRAADCGTVSLVQAEMGG